MLHFAACLVEVERVDILLDKERGFPGDGALIGYVVGKHKAVGAGEFQEVAEMGTEFDVSVAFIEEVGRDLKVEGRVFPMGRGDQFVAVVVGNSRLDFKPVAAVELIVVDKADVVIVAVEGRVVVVFF